MAALACASKGCSAIALNLRLEPHIVHSKQCSGRGVILGGRSGRQANVGSQIEHGAVQQRFHRVSCPGNVVCALEADHKCSELTPENCPPLEQDHERLGQKQHPSRRDLFLLSGAVGLTMTQPAHAEEVTAPLSAAPPNPQVESQTNYPPPEIPTAPSSAQPTKPNESPSSGENLPAAKQTQKAPPGPNSMITARAYLDVMICPGGTSRSERTLGDSNNICTPESGGEMLGRIVIGLYGKQVPRTVANFIAMVTGSAGSTYKGTIFHKIYEGQYIQAGKQGSRAEGHVHAPSALEKNPETLKAGAFALPHRRPGTVSLCLGVNDDEEDRKLSEDYRNVEFLITTGPGPVPSLDGSNIVFGTVLEGMDVVSRIAAVPSYQPNIRIKQFNELAEFLGDERAETARKFWDRPLQNVVISGCGVIQPKPSPLPNGQP